MKKLILIGLSILLMLGLSVNVMAEDEIGQYGVIEKYSDVVIPDGENAKVETSIEAITDENGLLAIPKADDSTIDNLSVVEGTIDKKIEEIDVGETKYYIVGFKEAKSKVVLNLKQTVEGVYELGKAKLKKTFPGDVKKVGYELQNTAPIMIDDYRCSMAVSDGYELFSIVDYDTEEDFSIFEKDGIKFGGNHFGKIKSGETFEIILNQIPENYYNPIIIWGIVIILSAFSLYKNKHLLEKAKDIKKNKKELKEGDNNA